MASIIQHSRQQYALERAPVEDYINRHYMLEGQPVTKPEATSVSPKVEAPAKPAAKEEATGVKEVGKTVLGSLVEVTKPKRKRTRSRRRKRRADPEADPGLTPRAAKPTTPDNPDEHVIFSR